ncbi:hypothetical protein RBSWK_04743 [Rhodopirellula baltica SWK14]|uniref:Uncharacterized protein n=1 Tax=Rhodopirellula baltica SWK14 TaxID=993516 RepID=L7CB79_RHOBT|nr:hypothetical protein RBSWK_04743 [Rhodopirellula baltica SWK14]
MVHLLSNWSFNGRTDARERCNPCNCRDLLDFEWRRLALAHNLQFR